MMQEPVSTVNPGLPFIILILMFCGLMFVIGQISEDAVFFKKCMSSYHDEQLCERYITSEEDK